MNSINKILIAVLSVALVFGAVSVAYDSEGAAYSVTDVQYDDSYTIESEGESMTFPALVISFDGTLPTMIQGSLSGGSLETPVGLQVSSVGNDIYIVALENALADGTYTLALNGADPYTFTVQSGEGGETGDDDKTVDSIAVEPPTDTEYTAGETLDLTGMVVTVYYTDGTHKTITEGYAVSPAANEPLTTDDTEVTVTYDGHEASFPITVNPVGEGYTVSYYDGETQIGTQVVPYDNQGFKASVTAPEKPGMDFVRWNTENGRAYNFDTPVTGNLSLYAMYELAPTNEMTVSGDSNTGNTVFDYNQIVTVNGTWTLVAGANITIMGQLVVPEGATLVIEPGATLVLAGVDNSEMGPVADIQGAVVIENDSESIFIDAGDIVFGEDGTISIPGADFGALFLLGGEMSVSGTVDAAGAFFVTTGLDDNDNVVSTGILTVETDAAVTVADNGGLAVLNGGEADVYGTVTVNGLIEAQDPVSVYGTVVIDSTAVNTGVVNIDIMAAEAVVDVSCYTVSSTGGMYITDANLVFKAATSTAQAVTVTTHEYSTPSTVELTVTAANDCYAEFSGLYVTEAVSQRTVDGIVHYTNTMDVSGDMGVYQIYNGNGETPTSGTSAVVDITAGTAVSVSGDMIVGENVTVNVAGTGAMTVTGSVDATAEGSVFTNAGTVTLSDNGIVTLRGTTANIAGTVNGTKYVTGSGNDGVTTYVTIDTALATVNQDGNEIRTITVYGEQTVTVSATLPTDVTMQLDSASDLQVGDAEDGADVVLTIAAGADVRGTSVITVNGTLYAEDKRDINSAVDIISDVYSEEVDAEGKAVRDGWARWTNIYTAVSEANPGDVIVINKTQADGNVVLNNNLTIPAGVTIVVDQGMASLYLMDGVTLTIAGTLQTYEDVYAETRLANTAMDVDAVNNNPAKKSSAIVVTGTLESFMVGNLAYGSGTAALSGGAPIYGAYYLTADSSVISSLDVALANVADIIGNITVNGPVNAGDLTFTATEECTTIVVSANAIQDFGANSGNVSTVLTVGSLTVVGGSVSVTATETVYGEINGTVVIGEASVELSDITGITVQDDEGMLVSGTVSEAVPGDDDCYLTVASGSVTTNSIFNVDVNVSAGATLVSNGARLNGTTAVDGTLDITTANSGNKNVFADDLVINAGGTFAVDSGEYADIATLTVYGDFTVAAETATAQSGSADIDVLYAGISSDDIRDGVDGTTGTVNGNMNGVASAYVSAQATLDDAALASMPDYETQLSVEGSVWYTAYGTSMTLPGKAPVENAYLSGWYNAETDTPYDLGADYTARADAVLTAEVEYNVYRIYVLANEAVDDVFIDGNLMEYGIINVGGPNSYYGYYTVVAAGNHEISYTVANGYSGDGVLYVNGTQQSGMTFTTEGTPTGETSYINYNLQLSGFEKSGYVPDSPDTTEDDGGMSITDILLIVLVILIIVMAIIVAVRLMRS